MKKIYAILGAIIPCLYGNALELTLTPGSLSEQFRLVREGSDESLVLKGEATSYDLTVLSRLPRSVKTLDLANLEIRGTQLTKDDWFGQTSFEDREIPAYMLLGSSVETLRLPSRISKIGDGAFSSTPIKKFEGCVVSWLGKGVFHDCRNLSYVDLSASPVSLIPERTFSECVSLEDIRIPSNVIYIGKHAFERTALKKVDIAKTNQIDDYAFANVSSLEEISLSSSCQLGEGAFFGVGTMDVISGSVSTAAPLAMALSSSPELIQIRGGEIGEGAFASSTARKIDLIGDVERINARAFYNMPSLKEVRVSDCTIIPEAHDKAFERTPVESIVLYVKQGEVEKWKQEPVWSQFIIMEDKSGIEEIGVSEPDILIALASGVISVSSATEISEVSLFSLDGKRISSVNPSKETVEISYPENEDIVIVRAVAGGIVRISKLKR